MHAPGSVNKRQGAIKEGAACIAAIPAGLAGMSGGHLAGPTVMSVACPLCVCVCVCVKSFYSETQSF